MLKSTRYHAPSHYTYQFHRRDILRELPFPSFFSSTSIFSSFSSLSAFDSSLGFSAFDSLTSDDSDSLASASAAESLHKYYHHHALLSHEFRQSFKSNLHYTRGITPKRVKYYAEARPIYAV